MRKQIFSTTLGLLLAALFLYITFRGRDPALLWHQVRRVDPVLSLGLLLLCWLNLFCRGLRWWFLLPGPLDKRDFWPTQRGIFLSYGVNNIASRIGEIVRIVAMRRASARGTASLTSSVVVDRVLFDFVVLVGLFSFVLVNYRQRMAAVFPRLEPAFFFFLILTICGISGLFLLVLRPQLIKDALKKIGLARLPALWPRILNLIDQLADGAEVLGRPGRLLALIAFNLLVWGLAVAYFWFSLEAVGIALPASQVILLFTISSLGLVLPSPGGLGTMHYFISIALIQFLAVEESQAQVAAVYSHGINYLGITFAALLAFFGKPKRLPNNLATPPTTP